MRRLVVSLALVVLTLVVYAPAVRFDFVSWDDPAYVTKNAHVRGGLSVDGVRWAFTTGDREDWHPLVAVSHMLDCDIFGLEAGGHHLTNILLHVANVLLLFAILDVQGRVRQSLTAKSARHYPDDDTTDHDAGESPFYT
jgi:hypothetical protein